MKIVHISIFPPKGEKHAKEGGVASYTKNLVSNTPYSQGDEVFILCNKLYGEKSKYRDGNVNVIRCFDKNFMFFVQLLREVNKIHPDMIHIQQELGLFGGVITAYLLQWLLFLLRRSKIVITIHGVVSLKKIDKDFVVRHRSHLPVWLVKIAFYVIYRPLCIWSTIVVVHEQYFKDVLIEEYGVSKKKVQVIYHGVEQLKTAEKKDACCALVLEAKNDIVLFMGYLTGYKDIDLLIDGFDSYSKKNKNAYLIIGAGKHPKYTHDKEYLDEYRRLKEKAKKKLDSKKYRWVGFIPEEDIVKYYSASDVSVYPYTICMSSSGPMAISLGCDKPFLASKYFADLLPDKQLLFDNTVSSLSDKLANFFLDKKKYQRACSKMRIERMWDKIGNETGKVYYSLLENK